MKSKNNIFSVYEDASSSKVDKTEPMIVRLVIKRPDSFKKLLEKPYDLRIADMMETLTVYMIQKTNATFGFYNYNEINLVFFANSLSDKHLEIQTHVSKTTSNVVSRMAEYLFESGFFDNNDNPSYERISIPNFDVRVFNLPDMETVSLYLISRMNICSDTYVRKMYEHHTGKYNGITNSGYLETQLKEIGIYIYKDIDPTYFCGKFSYRKKNPDFVSYENGGSKNIFFTISGKEIFKEDKDNYKDFIEKLSL